ncbi:hypothetical protein [Novosphingobium silvae]|jgi:hypothetical protein|uniref:hypothetical protein n=1 Tax=Novosphingobium silvae TaxID=2692619 RepID=UPI001928EC54|nr:hypothetical protein [Novosphingobium silvae]
MKVLLADDRRDRLAQIIALLAFATLIRSPAFGEWNFGIDDQFYALVGDRLRGGDLLYVDIWDRKGPLLYLIFAGIGMVWPSMLAYQLAATVSAGLGAYGVSRIARRIADPVPAFLAGIVYLALLDRFEGGNLEAGVFFNSLTIGAAALIIARFDLLRSGRIDAGLVLAFFCAGLAIAIKQTAAFEGILFGSTALVLLCRSPLPASGVAWRAMLLALAGMLPMIATGGFYWLHGHFAELWNAMVTSNFSRSYADPEIRGRRVLIMAGMMAIPLIFAAMGWHTLRNDAPERGPILRFLVLWAAVALALLFLFPNIFVHYAQAALPPLAILCTGYFAGRRRILPGLVALVALSLLLSGSFHLQDRWRARPAAQALLDHVREVTPSRRLLVWGAPSYLYSLVGAEPVTPLAFAPHLYESREWTGFDPVTEVRRVLASRPESVIVQVPLPSSPLNPATVRMVDEYVSACGRKRGFTIYDHNGPQRQLVFSACAPD